MLDLRFLCKYVVRVPWRLLEITVTIITIRKALLVRVEHKIVLLNQVRTLGKVQLQFEPTPSFVTGLIASFWGGAHSDEREVDVAKL
jgi:hypothetical protein